MFHCQTHKVASFPRTTEWIGFNEVKGVKCYLPMFFDGGGGFFGFWEQERGRDEK